MLKCTRSDGEKHREGRERRKKDEFGKQLLCPGKAMRWEESREQLGGMLPSSGPVCTCCWLPHPPHVPAVEVESNATYDGCPGAVQNTAVWQRAAARGWFPRADPHGAHGWVSDPRREGCWQQRWGQSFCCWMLRALAGGEGGFGERLVLELPGGCRALPLITGNQCSAAARWLLGALLASPPLQTLRAGRGVPWADGVGAVHGCAVAAGCSPCDASEGAR